MRSVYVVGGAGSGKSTFTQALLSDTQLAPLEDLASARNRKSLVTLRGHYLSDGGLYIGLMRESFPGTDGLDRASSPVGEKWLTELTPDTAPRYLLSEGATLATKRFLGALHEHTDLLLVHLHCDPEIASQRFSERGSSQDDRFVAATRTRSANQANEMAAAGARVLTVDTGDPASWELGLDLAESHLRLE